MNGHDAPDRQWRQPDPPPPPRRPSPARSVLTHTLAVVLGLAVGGVVGASARDDPAPTDDTAGATATVTRTATTTAPGEATTPTDGGTTESPERTGATGEIPGDGTYVVGSDIEPGTYRTAGPQDTAIPNCYWARLRGTSGEFNEIIANGNTAGPTTVTIASGDEAFQTTGCQTWKRSG
ncbi:hypothetical protein ACHBTE_01900 [Streptomyces sp. M41]|uniref:hypothetical protein n=1 Tax=Streptomyces sp. M41 TaxID=3059412 RepID=UPI00374DC98D